jgi:hypothetical protein
MVPLYNHDKHDMAMYSIWKNITSEHHETQNGQVNLVDAGTMSDSPLEP